MTTTATVVSLHNKQEIKHYEQLKGNEGKKIYYRPERFKARNLFRTSIPSVRLNNQNYILYDLSMSGFSVYCMKNACDGTALTLGCHLPVVIEYANTVLYEGVARVVRFESTPFGTKIGLQSLNEPFNISTLLDSYNMAVLKKEIQTAQQTYLAQVPAAYRLLCADLLHMLRRFKEMLDTFEKTSRINNTFSAEYESEMLHLCETEAGNEWQKLWLQGNAILKRAQKDPKELQALKKYTEQIITSEFLINDTWRNSYEKPFGYPGDFVVMGKLYDIALYGDSTYNKFLHALGLILAQFVRTRMALTRNIIGDVVMNAKGDRPVHIANIGCGLAREISSFLETPRRLPNIHFTLIDQDENALSAAHKEIYTASLKNRSQINLSFLNTSFTKMLKAGDLFNALPPQDMIYSIGIMDYLVEKRARGFIESLYERLTPGGTLLIGNMHDVADSPMWGLECVLDWNLIYRTEDQMLDLCANLHNAKVNTIIDKTRYVVFLQIQKLED